VTRASLCVFCGSSPGARPAYREAARALGRALAEREIRLVYGGAAVGLMGALADAALESGGDVVGVIPEALVDMEVAHAGLPDLRVVASMHERKSLMAELSEGFVALPGGFGTFEEMFEILTWAQLGSHRKPCGVLDVEGYFGPLVALLDHAVEERFLKPAHRELLLVCEDPDELLDRFAVWSPPEVDKWLDRQAR
jgi:uncharacterized protein (TIGR00730 family)